MAILSQNGRAQKSKHGSIKVESNKGTLRIRFTDPNEAFQQKRIKLTRQGKNGLKTVYEIDNPYLHYADFIIFLFGVGCRFGECAGLKWKHISDDFRSIWIGESVSQGDRKATKTGKARTVLLSPKIRQMLKSRKTRVCDPGGLVFPAPGGN